MVAHANQAGPDLVLIGIAAQFCQRGLFIQRWRQIQFAIQENPRRYGLLDQLDPAAKPQAVEHRLLFGGVRPKVASQKDIGVA
ncbi:hypothetical protein D3C78_1113700 [compost metagenome]